MDLSQLLKLGVKIIHQGKLTDRSQKNKEHRQKKRNDLVSQKRHLTDSPLTISPEPPKMEGKPSRLEVLKKWQEERNKRKAEEKAKQKPLFKVFHVDQGIYKDPVNLPPLSAKKEPTPSQYKFASSTHKFKLPPNIKPMEFKNNETQEKVPTKGKAVIKGASQEGNSRRKLNFKQENILPSKNNLNLDSSENKTTQQCKVINRKTINTPGSATTNSSNMKPSSAASKPKITRSGSASVISKETKDRLNTRPKTGTQEASGRKVAKTNVSRPASNLKEKIDNVGVGRVLRGNAVQPKSTTSKMGNSKNRNAVSDKNNSKKVDKNENDALNSTFDKDEADLVANGTEEESKGAEKGDVPCVRTRAMSRAQQKSSETSSREHLPHTVDKTEQFKAKTKSVSPREKIQVVHETSKKSPEFVTRSMSRAQQKSSETSSREHLPDTVDKTEQFKEKTISISPRKKIQDVNETLKKLPEFVTRAMSRAQQISSETSSREHLPGTVDKTEQFKENTKSVSPRKKTQVVNEISKNSPEFVEMKNNKTIDITKKNGRKALHSDSDINSYSKFETLNIRKSLLSEIETFAESVGRDSSFINEASFKSMSPEFPRDGSFYTPLLNVSTPAVMVSDVFVTPENKQAITYVSPYVTMSRGKTSARKEYHKRHSKGGFCEASPEVTGVKAGAAYFYKVLDDEILRIQNVCQEWTLYKDENNLPEEACDMINTALGQSGLLISKRMNQFRGLIDSCDAQNTDPLITCMDLHGYWDLLLIQVKNLDSRFQNLETLRSNNWEEVLPEKKTDEVKIAVKRPGRKKKAPTKSSSSIRNAVKAARLKILSNSDQQNVFDGGFFAVKSPMKSIVAPEKTPSKGRKSLLKVVLASDVKTVPSSPGLAICRATRKSRSIGASVSKDVTHNTVTPVKSILKTREAKSSVKKAVIFEEDVDEDTKNKSYVISCENNENDANSPNLTTVDEPARRSSRLSRNRLF